MRNTYICPSGKAPPSIDNVCNTNPTSVFASACNSQSTTAHVTASQTSTATTSSTPSTSSLATVTQPGNTGYFTCFMDYHSVRAGALLTASFGTVEIFAGYNTSCGNSVCSMRPPVIRAFDSQNPKWCNSEMFLSTAEYQTDTIKPGLIGSTIGLLISTLTSPPTLYWTAEGAPCQGGPCAMLFQNSWSGSSLTPNSGPQIALVDWNTGLVTKSSALAPYGARLVDFTQENDHLQIDLRVSPRSAWPVNTADLSSVKCSQFAGGPPNSVYLIQSLKLQLDLSGALESCVQGCTGYSSTCPSLACIHSTGTTKCPSLGQPRATVSSASQTAAFNGCAGGNLFLCSCTVKNSCCCCDPSSGPYGTVYVDNAPFSVASPVTLTQDSFTVTFDGTGSLEFTYDYQNCSYYLTTDFQGYHPCVPPFSQPAGWGGSYTATKPSDSCSTALIRWGLQLSYMNIPTTTPLRTTTTKPTTTKVTTTTSTIFPQSCLCQNSQGSHSFTINTNEIIENCQTFLDDLASLTQRVASDFCFVNKAPVTRDTTYTLKSSSSEATNDLESLNSTQLASIGVIEVKASSLASILSAPYFHFFFMLCLLLI